MIIENKTSLFVFT